MSKEIYISSTPHETRLAIVEKDELTEIYYERENEYTLAGSIYNGRVTRVLPGMQSSFVDIGLERDAFLYITDFMEEAGDSADFESADSRSARGEKRGEGRGRGRRDEEGTEASPEAAAEAPVRAEGEGRRERGNRNERGDRNKGDRGRRDGREAPAVPAELAPQDEVFAAAPRESDTDEIGEGAPGADGSRRWRGRRGRRRGRGGNDDQRGLARSNDNGEAVSTEAPEPEFQAEAAPEEVVPREERSGGRERRGRGEDRGGRHDSVRERFAPRGDRSGSREEDGFEASAPIEPIILPGESLSKYRRGEDADASASHSSSSLAPNVIIPKPSTEVVPLLGWDGGATLPGETLSRHRDRSAEPRNEGSFAREDRGGREGGNGRDRRRDRDQQRQGSRNEVHSESPRRELDPAEAVLPAVTSQHEPEANAMPFSDDAPAYETQAFEVQQYQQEIEAAEALEPVYEPQTDVAPLEAEAENAPVLEAVEELHETVEEFHETTVEYEPGEDASVTYRVDPVSPSEFRQSAPESVEALPEEAEGAPVHEFTTIQPTGEMISETPLAEVAPQDTENLAAPIEHEQAVQSVHLAQAETTPVPHEGAQIFAPGDGELEEELLDDEDSDLPHVHAGAFEDDMEEETLEGAADLGTMLREMSIDQITRPEPIELDDEDDDFDIDEEEIEEDEFESDDEISGSDVSEAEEEEFAEADAFEDSPIGEEAVASGEEGEARPAQREGERRGRRDGRRGGRGDRSGDRGSRDKRGMANSRPGGRPGRHSVQATDLPAISDLLKPGQEVLVQIAKEPIAKKGARITSHIALPGRFLVFMPTVNHVGVSRKIDSDGERRRLKEILLSEKGDASGGFIVRTAASGASEEELRSDLRFLLNLWADIKQRSESSKSPALIYHDLNLVERILRDQVTDNFSAIWVDTETEYERVLRFLQRFQPSLIRRVKLYTKETPLFEQFGITEEINKALRSKVWLKSGGSIVINQTEALVAIDINTGKYVGKTARLEDTIVKTNLDAIPEIVRQIRLRDLGGIIIIDFIDMDERKNRHKVMAALEEELKKDRAPSKVLQFNDFGLVAITRKRVKQSLERTLSTTCNICAGTGMVKSPITVCNDIYIEMRKMHKHLDKGDIMLRVNPEVVKQLKSGSGKWLQEMEEMSGKTILVKSDPSLHPEQFDIH
ncbi:Rne/Rng family ribonuclease [Granulicella mallensis]|uniref:Ribonuclease G n=1 Tax=Granulicella mallensis TaxID=940614 RepID=A0A7W7ZNB8_9BACT|nr:Rne/Rng family ribonuclease [Granulicella mallensis]MBB5062744.1 ribonuclease G [Granulicella mallensis]